MFNSGHLRIYLLCHGVKSTSRKVSISRDRYIGNIWLSSLLPSCSIKFCYPLGLSIHPAEPSGALLSSGKDMARYMRFLIKGGETEDGQQLLDPNLLQQAFIGIFWRYSFIVLTHSNSYLNTTTKSKVFMHKQFDIASWIWCFDLYLYVCVYLYYTNVSLHVCSNV